MEAPDNSKNNKQKTDSKSAVLGSVGRNIHKTRRIVLCVGIFLVVTALLVGGYFIYKRPNNNNQLDDQVAISGACSEGEGIFILQRAIDALQPDDDQKMQELGEVVEGIVQLPDFADDANCLYPVVMHYIYQADPATARQYYEQLEKTGQTEEASGNFAYKASLDDLKAHIEHLEFVRQETIDNTIYLGAPVEGWEEE